MLTLLLLLFNTVVVAEVFRFNLQNFEVKEPMECFCFYDGNVVML